MISTPQTNQNQNRQEKRTDAKGWNQDSSLGDFSSLSLSKVTDLNQSLAIGGTQTKLIFSPERESQKYFMRPISIKGKSAPVTSDGMMQTANFPNGPE